MSLICDPRCQYCRTVLTLQFFLHYVYFSQYKLEFRGSGVGPGRGVGGEGGSSSGTGSGGDNKGGVATGQDQGL